MNIVKPADFPMIVCLCGSTRFKDTFDKANYDLTMAGKIVLSVGFFIHTAKNEHGERIGVTPLQKTELDELHRRKIDLADEVFILNVGGYIGDSTRGEIDYSVKTGKRVYYLEREYSPGANCFDTQELERTSRRLFKDNKYVD